MRFAGCVVIVMLSGCGGGGGGLPADADGPTSDGAAADSARAPDAQPVVPARLALAAVSVRETIEVHADTGAGFRSVFSQADGLGNATGITWTDYDGDGRDDVVSSYGMTSMSGSNVLLVVHNDGADGLSIDREIGAGISGNAHGFDADGDGDGDVYAGDFGDPDQLFLSDGAALPTTRSWAEPGGSEWEYGIDAADLTGDGVPDIVLARGIHGEAVKQGNAAGPTPLWSQILFDDGLANDAAIVDWDGDGAPEISFAETSFDETTGAVSIYRWQGGQMQPVDALTQFGPAYELDWADLEGDGDADLAVCHGAHALGVYVRDGATLVPDAALSGSCYAVRWGDYDADGDADLAVADGGLSVYRNDGGGTWTPAYHSDQFAVAIAWGRCGPVDTPCFASAP